MFEQVLCYGSETGYRQPSRLDYNDPQSVEGSTASDADEFRLKTSAEEILLKYAEIVQYTRYKAGLNVCVCLAKIFIFGYGKNKTMMIDLVFLIQHSVGCGKIN